MSHLSRTANRFSGVVLCMTNTIALKQPIDSYVSETIATAKKRAGSSFRRIVAIALFVTGTLWSVGASLNLTLAKGLAKRVATKARQVKAKGEFRLLNIYNSLKASNPAMIETMNHATSGLASWYGRIFHGRKTAMGTTYNMYAMTAAHRSLPLGTWVQVTNERNGKSVVVQVTDRGPYVANRIMDLSYAAAQRLGYAQNGTTQISMKVLGNDPSVADASSTPSAVQSAQSIADSTTTASIIPAMFTGVTAKSENLTMADQSDSTPDVSTVLASVSSLAAGSPASAVAGMFA